MTLSFRHTHTVFPTLFRLAWLSPKAVQSPETSVVQATKGKTNHQVPKCRCSGPLENMDIQGTSQGGYMENKTKTKAGMVGAEKKLGTGATLQSWQEVIWVK